MGKKKGRRNKGKGKQISLTALIGDTPLNKETAHLPTAPKEYTEGELDRYGREVRQPRGGGSYATNDRWGGRESSGSSFRDGPGEDESASSNAGRGDNDNNWRRGGPPKIAPPSRTYSNRHERVMRSEMESSSGSSRPRLKLAPYPSRNVGGSLRAYRRVLLLLATQSVWCSKARRYR